VVGVVGVVGEVGEVGEVRVVGVGEGREVTQHTVHRATQQNPEGEGREVTQHTVHRATQQNPEGLHSNSTITCVYFYILHLVIRVQS
jgi:hypothetical protein